MEDAEGQKPFAWVACGDKQFGHKPEDDHKAMFGVGSHNVTTSEAQAKYWSEKCFLRVRPLYLGDPL